MTKCLATIDHNDRDVVTVANSQGGLGFDIDLIDGKSEFASE